MLSTKQLYQSSCMIITLITIFICLGYIFILYSILTQQQPSLPKIYITDKNLRSNDQSSSSSAAAASLLIQQQANLIHNLTIQIEQFKLETATSYNQHPILSMDITSTATSNRTAIPYRPGLIVLGMHRSGTSIVGGLLNKMGLHTGKHIRYYTCIILFILLNQWQQLQ